MRTHNRLCIPSIGLGSISLRNQVDANCKIDFEPDRNRSEHSLRIRHDEEHYLVKHLVKHFPSYPDTFSVLYFASCCISRTKEAALWTKGSLAILIVRA